MEKKFIRFRLIRPYFMRGVLFVLRQLYKLLVYFPLLISVTIIEYIIKKLSRNKYETDTQICFVITSVIYPKNKRLSYSPNRSVFAPEERARQTLKTIESIRMKVPEAKIIFVEAGLKKDLPLDIEKKVDQYVYVGKNIFVRQACDSKFKSLGEAAMLIGATGKFKFKPELYFKISGRYFLDEDFNLESWKTEFFKFFYIRDDYVSTRLYSFGKNMLIELKANLIKGLPLLILDYPIEHVLARLTLDRHIFRAQKVGIRGADATSGQLVKE